MSVGIVTDSGCDLPPQLESQLAIKTVPLHFRFGLEDYLDKSMPMKEFLDMFEKTWPTTSGPSVGEYIQAYNESLQDHEQVICIPITGKHSGSYSSAVVASQQFPPGQVIVIDSATLSIGQGYLVQVAVHYDQLGETSERIIARLREIQSRLFVYIVLDTVKYLVKGGRASQMTGILAGILKIRPILTLVDGQLTLVERPRGREASKKRLIELATRHFPAESVTFGHVDCADEARELASVLALQTGFDAQQIPVIEVGMAIATHGGPGTMGIAVVSAQS